MVVLVHLHRVLRLLAGAIIAATLLALLPAATLDLGPDGDVRFSYFPLVLTCFDPFIRTCLVHSLVIAVTVALGSRFLGVPIGRMLCGSRLVGRRFGRILFLASILFPPAVLALGLEGLPELESLGRRGFTRLGPLLSGLGVLESTWAEARGWLGWIGIGLIQGVAVVIFALHARLDRFDPSWRDSARLAGMTDRLIWRGLIWPFVRPGIARAVKLVFALNLVECGIPLVLGLRRSIGFQFVESARNSDPFPRLAAIALLAIACLAVGSLLVRIWVGPVRPGDPRPGGLDVPPPVWTSHRPWYAEILPTIILGLWLVVAWLPLVGLARLAARRTESIGHLAQAGSSLVRPLIAQLTDPRTAQMLLNSLIVGAAAAFTVLAFRGLKSDRPTGGRLIGGSLIWGISNVPPVILGAATLALPRLLELLTRSIRGSSSGSNLAGAVDRLAHSVDPTAFPLRLLAFAVCLDVVRRTWPKAEVSVEEKVANRDRRDAARLMGVKAPRAIRFIRVGEVTLGSAWLGFVAIISALSTAPAIVLGPTAEGRTILPGIIDLAGGNDNTRAQAALLSLCVCVPLLICWVVAVVLADRRKNSSSKMLSRWCDLDERRPRP